MHGWLEMIAGDIFPVNSRSVKKYAPMEHILPHRPLILLMFFARGPCWKPRASSLWAIR